MATTWVFAKCEGSDPSLHGAFLAIEPEDVHPRVTRYLVARFAGRLLPLGIDRFDSIADAYERCSKDLGLQESDWQELENPPEFAAPVGEAIDAAMAQFLARGNPKSH